MKNKNLLHSIEFISALQFEAGYASNVRGGHLPLYIDNEKAQRLVSDINLLSNRELCDLSRSFYNGKN